MINIVPCDLGDQFKRLFLNFVRNRMKLLLQYFSKSPADLRANYMAVNGIGAPILSAFKSAIYHLDRRAANW